MDSSSQVFSEEQKEQVSKELADALILGLENAQITVEDSEKSADLILDKFEQITSKDQLISLLEELSNAWPVYKNLFLKIKGEETKIEDQAKIADIQNNLDVLSDNQAN